MMIRRYILDDGITSYAYGHYKIAKYDVQVALFTRIFLHFLLLAKIAIP